MTCLLLAAFVLTCSALAEPIRVSFLTDAASREDTLDVLAHAGCQPDHLSTLHCAMTFRGTRFLLDRSAFPEADAGFYSFSSVEEFVSALTTRLSEAGDFFGFNCAETALMLAGCEMDSTAALDVMDRTYLAVAISTNNLEYVAPAACLKDVYDIAYPEWYRQILSQVFGRDASEEEQLLLAALWQFHALPRSMDEASAKAVVHETLQRHWNELGLVFPRSVSLVMLHRARLDYHLLVTDHMGILVKRGDGYMYLEKAGGRGPFVRIDTADPADLAIYYTTMTSPDYPLNFMTLNADRIWKVPLRGEPDPPASSRRQDPPDRASTRIPPAGMIVRF